MKYLLLALVLLAGCGTERVETQNTTEQEVWEFGPMAVETPAGTVVVHKTGVVRRLSRIRTTNEEENYRFPEAAQVGSAMLGGLTGPLAGGGLVGLIGAFFMRRMAAKNAAEREEMEAERRRIERQRDEVITGIERAKKRLEAIEDPKHPNTTAWDHLTTDLEREQSRDTVEAVRKVTA